MKPKGLSRRNFIKRSSYLGSAAAIQSLGLSGLLAASKSYASTDYKALVFIFLNGGNDAFNMLVPRSGTLRADYETGRGIVALPTNCVINCRIHKARTKKLDTNSIYQECFS